MSGDGQALGVLVKWLRQMRKKQISRVKKERISKENNEERQKKKISEWGIEEMYMMLKVWCKM